MNAKRKIAVLTLLATLQLPCAGLVAPEDAELATIAANHSSQDEQLGEINSALTDTITTKREQETDKDVKKRKKKLKRERKEKEKVNERKLKESADRQATKSEETIIIDPNESEPTPPTTVNVPSAPPPTAPPTTVTAPPPLPPTVNAPSAPPTIAPPTNQPPPVTPSTTLTPTPAPIETYNPPDQKVVYANFIEAAQAVQFIPLYMTRKSGYDIVGIVAGQNIVEIQYGRRWEPTIALAVRTYKRSPGEEPADISGVTDVKWRVDTSTGTTIYIAKISETEQVAAWAVGQYTFSARASNLSFASFHSLVADELVELSTHYYIDLGGSK